MIDVLNDFIQSTGFAALFTSSDPYYALKVLCMYVIIGVLFYFAIVKKFEPLLLLPIAFGMLLANLPGISMIHMDMFLQDHIDIQEVISNGGLIDFLYLGVKLGIYPSLIFLGVGAMTDFEPLIANPKSLFLGAAAQLGVFFAFVCAMLIGFTPNAASAIGIIGGADGPTAILVTKILAPILLPAIAIAAYSYMALIPFIQKPIMRALTTKKERLVKMEQLRPVSKTEKVIFPIVVALIVSLIVPDAAPLVGFLMLGNLFRVSGVTERLSKTAQNEMVNIITIFLGVSVGATAKADTFLKVETLMIVGLGLAAFIVSTTGGLLFGKLMYVITKGKINPLIGSAGVSAVPMAARVSHDVGRSEDPTNFLLMHAMGPNVAGVIGSAVAAGVFLRMFS